MHKVIVYHTISEPDAPLPANIDVSRSRFEGHLKWLARRREKVARLGDLLLASTAKDLIAITFDDGFRDNLTVALPLLEKYNLPATVFVTAGFLGKEGYLSPDELKTLAAHPLITIGSHGLEHLHLTRISAAQARHELTESKRILEEITGQTIDLLAYPYGDCSAAVERLSEECGYRAAWSVWNGDNTLLSLWRVPLGRNDNLPRFIAKISPFYFPLKRLVKPPYTEARTAARNAERLSEA